LVARRSATQISAERRGSLFAALNHSGGAPAHLPFSLRVLCRLP
jgi:hypothetical protein